MKIWMMLAALLFGCTPSSSTRAPGGAGKSPVGGPCVADGDCANGMSCDKDDPGGECTKKCSADADCGEGGVCTPEKECLQGCAAASDCKRAGYTCVGAAPHKYCDIPEANEKK